MKTFIFGLLIGLFSVIGVQQFLLHKDNSLTVPTSNGLSCTEPDNLNSYANTATQKARHPKPTLANALLSPNENLTASNHNQATADMASTTPDSAKLNEQRAALDVYEVLTKNISGKSAEDVLATVQLAFLSGENDGDQTIEQENAIYEMFNGKESIEPPLYVECRDRKCRITFQSRTRNHAASIQDGIFSLIQTNSSTVPQHLFVDANSDENQLVIYLLDEFPSSG